MQFFWLVLLTYIVDNTTLTYGKRRTINIDIDADHLTREPACGKVPSKASSRISNAIESEQHYPWVVFVVRLNDNHNLPSEKMLNCGGTIITKSSVVSAAHCVCGPTENDLLLSPDIREKIDCRGGRGNIRDVNNLPNEVREGINEIRIEAGSRNRKSPFAKSFIIGYAYVHDQYEHKTTNNNGATVDIAILKKAQYEPVFYSDDSLYGDFAIGPICLPAKMANLENGIFVSVGWGSVYGEMKTQPSDPTSDPIQKRHSCTTNTKGPIENIMKHCDVKYLKINGWTCDTNRGHVDPNFMLNFFRYLKNDLNVNPSEYLNNDKEYENILHYYPSGYDPNECEKLWNEADRAIRSRFTSQEFPELLDQWTNAERIVVGDWKPLKVPPKFRHLVCYREELFRRHGWCYTQDGIRDKDWGFCDTSCRFMHERDQNASPVPDTYHKITWKIDDSKPMTNYCIRENRLAAIWHLCVQSVLPDIIYHSFLLQDDGSLRFFNMQKQDQREYTNLYPRDQDAGYIQFCSGDSGSGSWSFNKIVGRYVLVSVSTYSHTWCGSESVVSKVTTPIIHEWIVRHSTYDL